MVNSYMKYSRFYVNFENFSWNKHWGIGGYLKLARNKNMCGIGNYPCYPMVPYIIE